MSAPTPAHRDLIVAATAVLSARRDNMLTIDEWVGLARALAQATGRRAVEYLAPRDAGQIIASDITWTVADGSLAELAE